LAIGLSGLPIGVAPLRLNHLRIAAAGAPGIAERKEEASAAIRRRVFLPGVLRDLPRRKSLFPRDQVKLRIVWLAAPIAPEIFKEGFRGRAGTRHDVP